MRSLVDSTNGAVFEDRKPAMNMGWACYSSSPTSTWGRQSVTRVLPSFAGLPAKKAYGVPYAQEPYRVHSAPAAPLLCGPHTAMLAVVTSSRQLCVARNVTFRQRARYIHFKRHLTGDVRGPVFFARHVSSVEEREHIERSEDVCERLPPPAPCATQNIFFWGGAHLDVIK